MPGMAIVCYLSSQNGLHVAVVAALLASRMKTSCHLAQSTEELAEGAARAARAAWVRTLLERRADRMRALARDVHAHVLVGPAEREVGALADRLHAQLIVTAASTGRADLLAQHVRVPVLVVREEAPYVRWASELSPLRIVAALAGSADVPAVLRMVRRLSEAAPCQVTLLHLANGDVATVEQDMREKLRRQTADPAWSLEVEQACGPRAEQIVATARARGAHLIITGSRVMARISRLWERSVSRRIVSEASCSVLCLPIGGPREQQPLQSVLAATDLTPEGDGALTLASRVVAPGGVVHVVHVVPRLDTEVAERALARLQASTQALAARDQRWKVHICYGDEYASALARAARTFAVDAVCVGRTGSPKGDTSLSSLVAQLGCALLIAGR